MQVCKQYSRVGCKRHPSPPLHPNRIQLISISFLNNWLRYCWSGKKQFYSWQTVIGRVEDYLPRRKVNSRGWEVGESDVNELLCMFWMCSIFRRGLTIIPIRRLYFPTWGSWGVEVNIIFLWTRKQQNGQQFHVRSINIWGLMYSTGIRIPQPLICHFFSASTA